MEEKLSEYYTILPVKKYEKYFWYCAGADAELLSRSTTSDRVRYFCLGGIVLATALMAAFAGGYAFYTIFEPKGDALPKEAIDPLTCLFSIIFGIIWGLIIFNLDRFIVSSTGKGDGTEKITKSELRNALPRIIMGMIIAITISKPIEIRMFKSEIDAALHKKQQEVMKDYEESTRKNFVDRIGSVQKEIDKLEAEKKNLEDGVNNMEKELTDQLQGKVKGSRPGDGPQANALKNQKAGFESRLQKWSSVNDAIFSDLNAQKKKLNQELDLQLAKNEDVAHSLDGLLERIKLAHEIAGWLISLVITLLFMAIELTPIFFKLMLTKSPYDYMKDNVDQLIMAQQGIYIKQEYNNAGGGKMLESIEYLPSSKIMLDKSELFKIQKELTQYALKKYEEKMKAQIDANPEAFVANVKNESNE